MKVYSSDINIDVNGSEQNEANPLLKVTGASYNVCRLRCFTTRWRQGTVKNVFVCESFIQEIHSKTHDSYSESLNHSFKRFIQKHTIHTVSQ